MFDPKSLSQSKLDDLRRAAELAWGEDSRHESFQGHPDPSQGQCFVTAAWIKSRLGGFVGTRKGHFFWVSPDKNYVLDITGDLLAKHGKPGPPVYVRAQHPYYRDFRILGDVHSPRADLFAKRADVYMKGGIAKTADLLGADAYPGSTEQKQEDWDMNAPMPMMHDEPDRELENQEYTFVMAHGELQLSPIHSHAELLSFSGLTPEFAGPLAVGYVDVKNGHALWHVTSNTTLRSLHQMIVDYNDSMGWQFDGMVGSDGTPIHEDFGPKRSMWYKLRKDGHLIMSENPLPTGRKIDILGKTAHVHTEVGPTRAAIQEWAADFGYRIAEYPGGGNMLDKMKNMPQLDQHNLGDQDADPAIDEPNIDNANNLECSECGQKFDRINELIEHQTYDHPKDEQQIPEDNFPGTPGDRNSPLDFGQWPYPSGAWDGLGSV